MPSVCTSVWSSWPSSAAANVFWRRHRGQSARRRKNTRFIGWEKAFMESPVPSMHIGILCDYGFTLLPKSGIGVFVYNLIDGLLTLSPPPQITLLTHPGDQEGLAECAERWQDRVRILPPLEESRTAAVRIERRLTALRQRCLDLEFVVSSRWIRVISKQKQQVLARLKGEWQAWRSALELLRKAEVRNPENLAQRHKSVKELLVPLHLCARYSGSFGR